MTDTAIRVAAERERAQAYAHLSTELDRMCRDVGLDPWEAWRRPRHLERIDAQDRVMLSTRVSASRVLGVRPRDKHGRFA